MFEEICLNALDLKTHIRINLDTVLVTMDSVNGTIGRSKESSTNYRRLQESFLNAMDHRHLIKTNSGIVHATMDFVNGMIGNRKESFPDEIQTLPTSYTLEELTAT